MLKSFRWTTARWYFIAKYIATNLSNLHKNTSTLAMTHVFNVTTCSEMSQHVPLIDAELLHYLTFSKYSYYK